MKTSSPSGVTTWVSSLVTACSGSLVGAPVLVCICTMGSLMPVVCPDHTGGRNARHA